MAQANSKLIAIQAARGLAALLVVLYHSGRMLSLPQYVGFNPLYGLFDFGHAGVDFFFVLSGFIIFYAHYRDVGCPHRALRYIWRRCSRIYPIYWILTAAVTALLLATHNATSRPGGYMSVLERIWMDLKTTRKVKAGPISLLFRFQRSRRVSSNLRRSFSQRTSTAPAQFVRLARKAPSRTKQPLVSVSQLAPSQRGVAVVFGAGPRVGYGLISQLARAGMQVAAVSRNAEKVDDFIRDLGVPNGHVRSYGCDATDARSVRSLMKKIKRDLGRPTLVTYGIEQFVPGSFLEIEVPAFEDCWRQNCLGSFIVAKEAARMMADQGGGTIVLIGATSATVGRAGYLNLAVGKFGQRAMAQVMARELGSKEIHVIHLIIDAGVAPHDLDHTPDHPFMHADDLANVVLSLHKQPRSAWTHELDVRPFDERFWEHC